MLKKHLNNSWISILNQEFDKEYMLDLQGFIVRQKKQGIKVFPKNSDIFNALNSTSFEDVKVVILGQDPYHGVEQAHGLCFSVKQGVKIPPSLKNIYKELYSDCQIKISQDGSLQSWARQGVLLLNSVLTVNQGQAASHQQQGWEIFTDKIISEINKEKKKVVYMLWGNYAKKKGDQINKVNNLVLESAHPSPLSAHRGFFGNKHFSQCNKYLEVNNIKPVDWQLPS